MNIVNDNIEIGIVGEGSMMDLLIHSFGQTDATIHMLDNQIKEHESAKNIRTHASLASLSRISDVIFTILSDGPEMEKTLLAEGGIASFTSSSSVIVDMSVVSPELTLELSEQLAEKEILFLDAAIINEEQSRFDAVQMLLIGGDEYVYEKMRPIFKSIAKDVKYLGAGGASKFYRQAFAVRAKKDPA